MKTDVQTQRALLFLIALGVFLFIMWLSSSSSATATTTAATTLPARSKHKQNNEIIVSRKRGLDAQQFCYGRESANGTKARATTATTTTVATIPDAAFFHLKEHLAMRRAIQDYVRYHQETIERGDYENTRFVVYVENLGGIGNHILPIVSTFLMGMATRRIALIHRISVSGVLIYDDLFEQPEGLEWELATVLQKMNAPASHLRNVSAIFDDPALTYDISIRHTFYPEDWNYLYCSKYNETKEKFVKIFSNQYFAPVFMHNSEYMDSLRSLFGFDIYAGGATKTDVFSQLSQYLFVPKPAIAKRLQEFTAEHFATRTVGIQLRKEFVNFPEWEKRWEDCAALAASELRGSDDDENSNDGDDNKDGQKNQSPVFFLASDVDATHIMKMWPHSKVITLGNKLLGRDSNAQEDAVMDMFLLAHSHAVVVTEHSTFGSSAVALGSHTPYVVTRDGRCRRYTSSQPHCHFCDTFVSKLKCHRPRLWLTGENTVEG